MNDERSLRTFQRRTFLGNVFPECSSYILNCCANDCMGLTKDEMKQLMTDKWIPMSAELNASRREQVASLEVQLPQFVDEAPKDQKKKKKSRLQGGCVSKPKAKPSVSGPSSWGGAVSLALPSNRSIDVVRPGLVVMKNVIPLEVQQHFADVTTALATPTNNLSGGWYTVKSNGDRIFNTGETWGATTEELKHFPQQYRTLCLSYLEKARAECDALPELNPNIVLMNNYTPDNAGIYWHRDNSTADRYAVERGLPVVSFSIGCSCDFAWKMESTDSENNVVLNSGDVLIFGGPMRNVLHAVPRVYSGTMPKGLKMTPGRINLTFREQCIN